MGLNSARPKDSPMVSTTLRPPLMCRAKSNIASLTPNLVEKSSLMWFFFGVSVKKILVPPGDIRILEQLWSHLTLGIGGGSKIPAPSPVQNLCRFYIGGGFIGHPAFSHPVQIIKSFLQCYPHYRSIEIPPTGLLSSSCT